MPKRFSKTKILEAKIDVLKDTNKNLRDGNMDLHGKIYMLRAEISEAKSIIGSNSVLFRPQALEASRRDLINVIAHRELKMIPPAYGEQYEPMLRNIRLPTLIASIENKDALEGLFHIRCVYANEIWGYAIAPQCFDVVPEDIMIKRIAEELATKIVYDLKAKNATKK